MKKIIYFLILIGIFILGLVLGTKDTISKNQLIDDAKNNFEISITNPNNDYQTLNNEYEENIFNTSANLIDEIIQKIIAKIKNKI